MKTRRSIPRSGAALLTVLAVTALVFVLVVLFFTLADRDRKTSGLFRDSVDARALADLAVNLVISQIRQATTPSEGQVEPVFWASQPGAIRTWKRDGAADRLFKLYSSSESVSPLSDTIDPAAWMRRESERLASWDKDSKSAAARFADMNEPIPLRDSAGDISDLVFPIADPRAQSMDRVEGFSIGPGGVNGTILSADKSARLPMPVEWIYLLQDGSMGTLGDDGKFIPAPGAAAATAENPIVARVAYWTDDESCKININTASEGIPWDTPRCVSRHDVDYALKQPARNEVQRWPGHPATVCLSSVFFPGEYLDPTSDFEKLRAIYDLAPRVHYANGEGVLAGAFGQGLGGIAFDDDRLYATVDEALLRMDRTENSLFRMAGNGREKLDRCRFFLTTNSRAPELTLSGHPRICLWPVNENHTNKSNRVTQQDRVIHFTTTLGDRDGFEYHVQRQKPESQVDEYHLTTPLRRNSELAGYLESLLHHPTPKYGLPLFEKYPGKDWWLNAYRCIDFIRSTNLHDSTWISADRRVTPYQSTKIPGIVSGCALSEIAGKPGVPAWVKSIENYRVPGRDYTISEVALVLNCVAHHKSTGEKIGPSSYFSSTNPKPLLRGEKALQAALLFEGFCPDQGRVMILPHLRLNLDSPSLLNLRVNGSRLEHNGHSHDHKNLFEAWGEPPFTYGNTTPKGASRGDGTRRPDNWIGWGGSGGHHIFTSPIAVRDRVENSKLVTTRTGYYTTEFFRVREGDPVQLTSVSSTGKSENNLQLDLTLERTWVTTWDARQRLRLHFPLPLITPSPEIDSTQSALWTWEDRMKNRAHKTLTEYYRSSAPYDQIILPGDVVRSVVIAHGDYRLPDMWGRKSGRFNDPSLSNMENYFAPHPGYDDSTRRQAHSLAPCGGDTSYYAGCSVTNAGFAKDASYAATVQPDFPIGPATPVKGGDDVYARSVSRAFLQTYGRAMLDPAVTRDWNNGDGIAPDGAYAGKSDDGSLTTGGVGLPPFDGNLPPYFNKRWDDRALTPKASEESPAPNRLMNSAGIFGSFPSMPTSNVPWTTWLFRPDLSGGHIGARWNSFNERKSAGDAFEGRPSGRLAPPDHLLMDLFWMPAITPYGISERFSSAGKINLNYQMLPFTWVERKTALHAVLKAEEFLAIPSGAGADYKNPLKTANAPSWRHRIDAAKTLVQYDEVFRRGDAFASASEICEYFLVPLDHPQITGTRGAEIQSAMKDFWAAHNLTGDNSLERPYANLFAKLTTRSNVFRVHVRAQSLRKARSSKPDHYDPNRDSIRGEYRGETLVERFLPPNRPNIGKLDEGYPDYATNPSAAPLDRYYHFRIISHRRFSL